MRVRPASSTTVSPLTVRYCGPCWEVAGCVNAVMLNALTLKLKPTLRRTCEDGAPFARFSLAGL